jgi:hypothetical protein
MLGPYRASPVVDRSVCPDRCVPDGAAPGRCPRAPLAARLARALASSAPLLLVAGSTSACVVSGAATWAVLEDREAKEAAALPAPGPWAVREAPLLELGSITHNPEELWRRAEHLAATNAPLTLVRAEYAPEAVGRVRLPQRALRECARPEEDGVRVVDAGPDSPAALLGLRRGDLITSVNGYSLQRSGDARHAGLELAVASRLVIELTRGNRVVALRVDAFDARRSPRGS